VDVNRAPREALLRVPGLGRETVEKLLKARRHHALRRADLSTLRVARRAAPFLVTSDDASTPARLLDSARLRERLTPPEQLGLFEARRSVRRGEV
jgi:predicted DNA-binding helix-hairpin-helix protein